MNKISFQKLMHISVLISVILLCSSFQPQKPHLIVGLWSSIDTVSFSSPAGKDLEIDQWYFSSDDIISEWSFKSKKKKTQSYTMAYKIMDAQMVAARYEDMKKWEHSNLSLILLKSTCDKDFRAVFSIQKLTKDTLIVQFEPEHSDENVGVSNQEMTFERIAGPPENM